ncbi:hydrolase [Enterococcus florum]|uniref:Hydrolase n=1 Tax=Enterococcus florum TaxID=2480627 RepID=A0A4P5PA65_9ENTE|nr:HAD family hydrolase [Enterococcus florum]GCF93121.1 hydrolase [Enterococcus florum]
MAAIIFDVDDTLYDQLTPFQLAFTMNFPNTEIPVEQLFKYSRIYSDEVFELSENGSISKLDMQIYRIRKALAHYDIQITDEQGAKFQANYQYYQSQIQLDPAMQEALDLCVAHHFPIGIITNGPAEHQKKKIKQLGLNRWVPTEQMLVSGEWGVAKPDIRIFELAEAVMDLKKETTYYVGDSYENDVVGAKNAGWKAVWINRRNHAESSEIKADILIDQETTIKNFLLSLVLTGA